MTTGEHFGRLGYFTTFKSKDKQTNYAKLTMGSRKKFGDEIIIQEVERVYLAEYHSDSELVKMMEKLGAIEEHKFYPGRLLNKPVKFTVKINENAKEDSRYKEMVTDIEPIDELSEDIDFMYVREFTSMGYEYKPVVIGAKKTSHVKRKSIAPNKSKVEFPEEDEEDYLGF